MRTKVLGSFLIASSLTGGLAFADGPRTYQTTNMFQAGSFATKKPGAATLVRSKQGVELRVATSGLDMLTSYTIWWVVFNNPAACTNAGSPAPAPQCGMVDFPNPAVQAAVFYAAGFVTGMTDTANVTAHMEAGALPVGVELTPDGTAPGLHPGNGFGAEIHVVVRSHGLTNPGFVDQQIGSFNGACNAVCANKQAAVFRPVQ